MKRPFNLQSEVFTGSPLYQLYFLDSTCTVCVYQVQMITYLIGLYILHHRLYSQCRQLSAAFKQEFIKILYQPYLLDFTCSVVLPLKCSNNVLDLLVLSCITDCIVSEDNYQLHLNKSTSRYCINLTCWTSLVVWYYL
ncbi:hypothetical protein ACROYT_G010070 [Oculina patagonica]